MLKLWKQFLKTEYNIRRKLCTYISDMYKYIISALAGIRFWKVLCSKNG